MLSFVIPARNEAPSIVTLVNEIRSVCDWNDWGYDVILIDDGSSDSTWEVISKLAESSAFIKGIKLRRNFGKGPALAAGIKAAKGDIIFMLDADLQDNPEDIPQFLEKLKSGVDGVIGWRKSRKDSWAKTALSRIFNLAVGTTGLRIHDHNCGFKCFRREVLTDLRLYGDMHRYIPILAHMNGFKITEVPVNHRERRYGTSNYGLGRTYRGFFDLFTIMFLKGFRFRPMHLLGTVGFVSLLLGMAGLTHLAVIWILGESIGARPLLPYSVGLTIFGCQVLTTGALAELMTVYFAKDEVLYLVSEESPANRGIAAVSKIATADLVPTAHDLVPNA